MKKIILSTSLAMSLLVANEYGYEITPKIGYVDTKEHVDIKNHNVFGLGVAKNMGDDCKFDKLEFSLLQSGSVDYENSIEDTKVTIISFNGIKEYNINEKFNLYAVAGLGYEHISDSQYNNESDPFFNYGVGAAYSLTKELALKLDVRHELKFDGDKNVIYTLGLAIPFGEIAPQKVKEVAPIVAEPVEEPVKEPQELDSDNDGVVDSKDHCRVTKEGAEVDANGCTIIPLIDTDKDGILDSIDQCPNTQMGVQVDHNGCQLLELPAKIGMIFETNSHTIKTADLSKFDPYVAYVQKEDGAKIIVEAHTDSSGSLQYNQTLSQKRAESVKSKLVSLGVDKKTIQAIGYGETQPLVSNDTEENKAQNRRVTVRIEK